LRLQGRPVGGLRSPLVAATEAETAALARCLEAAGLPSAP
jgi:4-hydroxy-tetrahydrodipicolinate synthase